MEINLNHLHYFFDAADSKSLSIAATKNRVSQSAISQAIRKLEEQMECKLLVHQRKRLELTDAGRTAYRGCRAVFDAISEFRGSISESPHEYRGELRLASSNSIAMCILPSALNQIRRDHPRLAVSLRLGNSETVRRWLADGEIDAGLVVDDWKSDRLIGQVIHQGMYILAAPNPKNATSRTGIFVTRRDRPEVQSALEAWRKTREKPAEIQMEVTSWEAMKTWVLAGLGMGLFPEYVVASELKAKKLKRVPLTGWRHPYELRLLTPNDGDSLRCTNLLIRYLQKKSV